MVFTGLWAKETTAVIKRDEGGGCGYSARGEHSPSVHKALGSISAPQKQNKTKNCNEIRVVK